MKDLFLQLLDMSITASFLVVAVVILRLVLKKAPKNMTILLWVPVAIRLLCPVSVESVFSLIPEKEFVPAYQEATNIPTVIVEDAAGIPMSPAPTPTTDILSIISIVWIVGVVAMLAYTLVTYGILKYRMRESMPLEGRVWLSDRAQTPYILGVIMPKIYVPSAMSKVDREYVLAHENAHLSRGDHLLKPLAFLLLSVYWFNPLMWVAYILLCRDMEMACDERVIRDYDDTSKVKAYSQVLVRCSVPNRSLAACPVAFGETAVKSRVKAILCYKKPTFWITLITALVGVVLVVCFLTDPESGQAATHDVTNATTQAVTQTTVLPSETTVLTTSVTSDATTLSPTTTAIETTTSSETTTASSTTTVTITTTATPTSATTAVATPPTPAPTTAGTTSTTAVSASGESGEWYMTVSPQTVKCGETISITLHNASSVRSVSALIYRGRNVQFGNHYANVTMTKQGDGTFVGYYTIPDPSPTLPWRVDITAVNENDAFVMLGGLEFTVVS